MSEASSRDGMVVWEAGGGWLIDTNSMIKWIKRDTVTLSVVIVAQFVVLNGLTLSAYLCLITVRSTVYPIAN